MVVHSDEDEPVIRVYCNLIIAYKYKLNTAYDCIIDSGSLKVARNDGLIAISMKLMNLWVKRCYGALVGAVQPGNGHAVVCYWYSCLNCR